MYATGHTITKKAPLKSVKALPDQVSVEDLVDCVLLLSKIERGERKAKKEQVPLFEKILKVKKDELLTLWLADQVLELVSNEPVALKAIDLAQREIKGLISHR